MMNGQMLELIEIKDMLNGYDAAPLRPVAATCVAAEQEFTSWLDRRRTIFVNRQLNEE